MSKLILAFSFIVCSTFFYSMFPESRNTSITELNIQNLSKKWYLKEYKVFTISYSPEEIEKNDYIFFNENLTFISVSEGVYEAGIWRLDKRSKIIFMSNEKGKEELKLIVKSYLKMSLF